MNSWRYSESFLHLLYSKIIFYIIKLTIDLCPQKDLMYAFLVGAFAPYILGTLKPTLGLAAGLSWLWVSYLLGSVLILTAVIFFFKKDRAKLNIL